MARKSERLSSSAKAEPTHKRVVSATATPGGETKRRKRATPKKSQYFEGDDDESELSDERASGDESEYGPDDASDFKDAGEKAPSTEVETENEDEESGDEPKQRRKSGQGASSTTTASTKGKELWRPGVKAGLGNQVIIKKPQPRKAGKTPYSDETIHPNTMLFLKDLKENNDRVWLKSKYRLHF